MKNNFCDSCGGKCCVGEIDVYPFDDIYSDENFTVDVSGKPYDKMMKTKDNVCITLENGLCSIYEIRPTICKAFQVDSECCRMFRNKILDKHECKECVVGK